MKRSLNTDVAAQLKCSLDSLKETSSVRMVETVSDMYRDTQKEMSADMHEMYRLLAQLVDARTQADDENAPAYASAMRLLNGLNKRMEQKSATNGLYEMLKHDLGMGVLIAESSVPISPLQASRELEQMENARTLYPQ